MNKTDYRDMWVYIEHDDKTIQTVSLELCSEVRKLCDASGEKLAAVVISGLPQSELDSPLTWMPIHICLPFCAGNIDRPLFLSAGPSTAETLRRGLPAGCLPAVHRMQHSLFITRKAETLNSLNLLWAEK